MRILETLTLVLALTQGAVAAEEYRKHMTREGVVVVAGQLGEADFPVVLKLRPGLMNQETLTVEKLPGDQLLERAGSRVVIEGKIRKVAERLVLDARRIRGATEKEIADGFLKSFGSDQPRPKPSSADLPVSPPK